MYMIHISSKDKRFGYLSKMVNELLIMTSDPTKARKYANQEEARESANELYILPFIKKATVFKI